MLIIRKKQICEAFISFAIQSYNYIDIVVKGCDMNVGNIYDTSVKTFPSAEAGLISFNGHFGYLLAFIYEAFTQTFDPLGRILSDGS